MGDVGLLLSLPTDSIAVRVALASTVAVIAGRLLLRAGLRSPRVRALVALLPADADTQVVDQAYSRSGCDFFRLGATDIELLARTRLLVRRIGDFRYWRKKWPGSSCRRARAACTEA